MKKSTLLRVLFAISCLSVLIIGGCKKEAPAKPTTVNTVTVNSGTAGTSVFKGTFDGVPISFASAAIAYNGYVDPDSANQNGNGNGNGNGHDNDAYYVSGSKWVTIGNSLPITNASIELRSLAVRVFVSPTHVSSSNFFNLINLATYPVATDDNPSQGAYISLRDQNGILWTSSGDQDGSSFTISSVGANMVTYAIVSGTITSKMYDGAGHMKNLRDATFTAALGI